MTTKTTAKATKANGRAKAKSNGAKSKAPTNRLTAKEKSIVVEGRQVVIPKPNFQTGEFKIIGNAPYCQNKFSKKAKDQIKATQEGGSTSTKGKKRDPKDFQACYEQAIHKSTEGWYGIPAPAFRNAMISACKTVGFFMTKGKQCLFCVADGIDADDGTPLVKITKGKPEYSEHCVRPEKGGVDIRPRPMWPPGWEATVTLKYDADQFTLSDIANLLMRVGVQVGVGEGRPDSPKSCGMGWGTFDLQE